MTAEDWLVVEFYRRVEDQFVNQQPMGGAPNTPPVLTLRLESLEAALRIYEYPRALWVWLVDWVRVLHRLVRGMEKPALTEDRRAHLRSLGVEC